MDLSSHLKTTAMVLYFYGESGLPVLRTFLAAWQVLRGYVSYENASDWPLMDNGAPVPYRVPFEKTSWDQAGGGLIVTLVARDWQV